MGKISVYDKIVLEKVTGEKMEIKEIFTLYMNFNLKDGLGVKFTACYSELTHLGALAS